MHKISDLKGLLSRITQERHEQARLDIVRLLTTARWVTKRGRGVPAVQAGKSVDVTWTDGRCVVYTDQGGTERKTDLDNFIQWHTCPELSRDMWMDYHWCPQ